MNLDIDISKFRKLDGGLLLVFGELLNTHSVTRTAQALSLSQSTISQALGRLRELFDDPLFVRRSHGMEPTEKALALQPRIANLIEVASMALDAGQSFDPKTSTRQFTVSSPEFVTSTLAAKLLTQISNTAPGVSLAFVHLEEHTVLEAVRQGRVALALGRFERDTPDVEQQALYVDEFCVVCRAGHPIARGKLTMRKYREAQHLWANAPSEVVPSDAQFDYSSYRGSVVPRWLTALSIVARSDYIATCPRQLAASHAEVFGLKLLSHQNMPSLTVSMAIRRDQRDQGVLWLQQRIATIFES